VCVSVCVCVCVYHIVTRLSKSSHADEAAPSVLLDLTFALEAFLNLKPQVKFKSMPNISVLIELI
jgi:hypothetical protein